MISLRLRGLLGTVFSSSLKGLAKLKAMRARLRYGRLKFEKYLETKWELGSNPCAKIPIDL